MKRILRTQQSPAAFLSGRRVFCVLLSLLASVLLCTGLSAQGVTVGAGIKPQPGAMLDMKSIKVGGGSHNSSLGLMLPRAALLELDKLYPMFAKKAADGVTVFPVPAEPTGDYTPDKQAAHA